MIQVKANQAISVTPVSKSDKRSVELFKKIDTIEKIFNLIGDGFEKGFRIKISYDKKHGFPKKISIEDVKKGTHGWMTAEIREFVPVIDK